MANGRVWRSRSLDLALLMLGVVSLILVFVVVALTGRLTWFVVDEAGFRWVQSTNLAGTPGSAQAPPARIGRRR